MDGSDVLKNNKHHLLRFLVLFFQPLMNVKCRGACEVYYTWWLAAAPHGNRAEVNMIKLHMLWFFMQKPLSKILIENDLAR